MAPSDEGRLSPMGRRERLFYDPVNGFAYAGKVFLNIHVAETKNDGIHSLQFTGTLSISLCLLCVIVSAAVQLDNKSCLRTVKVRNIITDGFLPLEANGIIPEKIIP